MQRFSPPDSPRSGRQWVLWWAIAANLAPAACCHAQWETTRLATLNCEFLIRSRIHVKYGFDLDLEADRRHTPEERARWRDPSYREARFDESVAAVARVIRRIEADVIGLCEVGGVDEVRSLRNAVAALGLDYLHLAVCNSSDTVTMQHVAVLSKHRLAQVWPTIEGRESYLAEPDDPDSEMETGISKGLMARVQLGQRQANLLLVHLASERGGHEQDAQRLAQASIVRRRCLPLLERGEHVIVMGDLNGHRGQPVVQRIRGLDDIFEDLIQPAGPVFNRRRDNETTEQYNRRVGDHWTYEFAGRRQQLDHILISQSIRAACGASGIAARFVDTDEPSGGNGMRASDHRAVVVELLWK